MTSAVLSVAIVVLSLPLTRPRSRAADPAEGIERQGAGSLLLRIPPGAKGPPAQVYREEGSKGPMPTGDWWSSLAWLPHSEAQYAHPLVLKAEPGGLRVFHAARIEMNGVGIFGSLPGGGSDLVIGHSGAERFPDARAASWSDWFVTAVFAAEGKSLRLTYGHGSPFVYGRCEGGDPVIRFPKPPEVWSGDGKGPVLAVAVDGKAYGLFGPTGSTWSGLGTAALICRTGGTSHFSVGLLPAKSREALDLFRRHAHAHVTGSRVSWSFDESTSAVTTRLEVETEALEKSAAGTLLALYPHQWLRSADPMLPHTYPSVRGPLKLLEGAGFTTKAVFPGILPALPVTPGVDKERLRTLLAEERTKKRGGPRDTYWEGKLLGRLAAASAIAEACGAPDLRDAFTAELRSLLEGWFTATGGDGRPKDKGVFAWDRTWGTVIGYPASYGTDVELNDHHFHYGYFIRAAAEVARVDPEWAAAERWGAMVRLLIRDIACPDRDDARFPFLRCFDPYAGHSWASGKAGFPDGNNQESSSEAMNAWAAIVLWGEAVGDRPLRDLGIWLYTTELAAIEDYWFDVEKRLRPAAYTPSVVTMLWGGKGVNETWFSRKPALVHGINWLPFHGGSLYLGRFPSYCRRNYEALVLESGGAKWAEWGDLILMYRALDDPADALRRLDASPGLTIEEGNSRANLYHWIHALAELGQVDRTVTADHPLHAVFMKDGRRSYVAWNAGPAAKPLDVRFSDGTAVQAGAAGPAVVRKEP